MATILSFRQNSTPNLRPKGSDEPCQVVFFTGVRYEKSGRIDGQGSGTDVRDRLPDMQGKQPG